MPEEEIKVARSSASPRCTDVSSFDRYKQPAVFHILIDDIKAGRVDQQLKDAIAEFKNGNEKAPFHIDHQRLNAYLRSRFLHRHKGRVRRSIPKRREGDMLAIEMVCHIYPMAVKCQPNVMGSPNTDEIKLTVTFEPLSPKKPSHVVPLTFTESYRGEEAVIVNGQQEAMAQWAALIDKNNAPLH